MRSSIKLSTLVLSLSFFAFGADALANVCRSWEAPTEIGELKINDDMVEQSGFDFSRVFADRLYHISEAKRRLSLYISKTDGSRYQKVRLLSPVTAERYDSYDVEDISTAPCFSLTEGNSCIFLADIGGGKPKLRNRLRVSIVIERELWEEESRVRRIVLFDYPYGESYDAEAFAVHPQSGNFYVITKHLDHSNNTSAPAKVFRLPAESWLNPKRDAAPAVLEFIGELSMANYARTKDAVREAHGDRAAERYHMYQAITAADISEDGKYLAIATYRDLFQFSIDLDQVKAPADLNSLRLGAEVSRINLEKPFRLVQQEAIAFLPDRSDSFAYTTEYVAGGRSGDEDRAPIYSLTCSD